MKMSHDFGMPNGKTFGILPITKFINRWVCGAGVIVDPFSGGSQVGTITNDLNPDIESHFHMEAEEFCLSLCKDGVQADVVLFDPPYSPRQISELYKSVGLTVGMKETQNARLYRRVRDRFDPIVRVGGCVLSFGWNSNCMGEKRGYVIEEILLVRHGSAHNDTICVAEKKIENVCFPAYVEAVL